MARKGCLAIVGVAVALIGGLFIFALIDNPMEAPRAQIEAQIQNAIPGDPIVFFQVQTEPGEEASSFGIVERMSGIVLRDSETSASSEAVNTAFSMSVGSHPVVATYGPDDQLDRLAIVSFPVLEGERRDDQIDAVVAIVDSVTPNEDAAEIRTWINETLRDYSGRPAGEDDAMIVRRSFGLLNANITLDQDEAFVNTMRPGIEMIVGLVP
mgnify:FL=1